ncbi:twin-arginine translocase TatA/TatE family subunit [bacterium]|nr:twin-arginine translocase TatA/TatE family subunit [bacterium]
MFGSLGSFEIFIILLVALLLFGSKQLPQVARNIGKGLRDFQKAAQNARDEIHKILEEEGDKEDTPKKPMQG